jgi:hypothetical protein
MWLVALCALAAGLIAIHFAGRNVPCEPRVLQVPSVAPDLFDLPVAIDKMGYPLLPLLGNHEVQRELALSREQQQRITAVTEGYMLDLAPQMALLRASSSNQGFASDALAACQVRQTQLLLAAGDQAASVLDTAQRRRLGQIVVRLRSIEIFALPEFVKALALTATQQAAICEVRRELETAARRLSEEHTNKRVSGDQFNRAIEAAFERAERDALAFLTARQRRQWEGWRGGAIPFTRQSLKLVVRGSL